MAKIGYFCTMTRMELRKQFIARLTDLYSPGEIGAMFSTWSEKRAGLHLQDWILEPQQSVDLGCIRIFEDDLGRLEKGEPIQYVLNEAWFDGRSYYVDKRVLIPRPETEELVRWILESHNESVNSILDLGTGSGVIPISLKLHRPNWNVDALDISSEALEVAQMNATKANVAVNFYRADMAEDWPNEPNIVVSNPPYIPPQLACTLSQNVVDFEPSIALFSSEDDGLDFYSAIANQFRKRNNIMEVYLEINNEKALETKALFSEFNVEIRLDVNGNQRLMKVSR